MEDLAALIARAGATAHVFGASSGGALALEATAAGLPISNLVVYEVPYDMSEDAPQRPAPSGLRREAAGSPAAEPAGRRLCPCHEHLGAPEEMVKNAKQSPMWPKLEALAHTLSYDAACMGTNQPPVDRLARITQSGLILTGSARTEPTSSGTGGGAPDFFGDAADAIAAAIPRATRQTITGQGHIVDAESFAPILKRFLAG